MMADGGAAFAQTTGLVLDLTAKGFGLRSQRLLDAGQGWRREVAQCRGARQVRGE